MDPDVTTPASQTTGGESAAGPPPADDSLPPQLPRKSHAWRWWLFGFVCAIGLGIFMWAVGGHWNLNAPRLNGPAATPQQAVQKFMAAVDNHDKGLAGSYCTPEFVDSGQVDEWISRTGYLRFVAAEVVSENGDETIMRVRYELVTRFLDDQDPQGLNLAFAVFPQKLTTFFGAVRSEDGTGWLVSASGPEL